MSDLRASLSDVATGPALIDGYPRVLTVVGVVGAGLVAGVFFAFSTFVMPGLKKLPASQGIPAMQSINRSAEGSPLFMGLLFGTALVCVALIVTAVRNLGDRSSAYLLAGAVLYLLCIVLTAAYHVPHNNALALVDPASAGAVGDWGRYVTGWTGWNHVRTVTSAAGSIALVIALRIA